MRRLPSYAAAALLAGRGVTPRRAEQHDVGGEGADFAEGAYFPIFSRLLYDEICPFEIYSLLASLDWIAVCVYAASVHISLHHDPAIWWLAHIFF